MDVRLIPVLAARLVFIVQYRVTIGHGAFWTSSEQLLHVAEDYPVTASTLILHMKHTTPKTCCASILPDYAMT